MKKKFKFSRTEDTAEGLFAAADIVLNGTRPWDIQIHDKRFYRRVLVNGTLGFGEAYMDGWWDCEAIDEMCFRAIRARLNGSGGLWNILTTAQSVLLNLQNRRRACMLGKHHYDLGNEFFEAMLGPTMQYSCAYFPGGEDLTKAQIAKMDLICRKLRLEPGMRLLDVGCGWGGLARYVAENYGCSVMGITVSREQQRYGQQYCRGLPIEICLKDYRDVSSSFDRILSVGMMEHVGRKNYCSYMQVIHRCLKSGGLFLCHTICRNRPTWCPDPWIGRYIFPNSILPAASQVVRAAEGLFVLEDAHSFGVSYDQTLRAWEANFQSAWPRFEAVYGERFRRMWRYYLLSCAGAFRARSIQLFQFVFSRGGILGGYFAPRGSHY